MTHDANAITEFFSSESGAVTVDWVVLTAALVGLGLATMAVVSGGVEDLSGDTRTQLDGVTIQTSFAQAIGLQGLFDSDFSNGAAGWVGGTLASLGGFGDVLQVAGGQTAELALQVPAGATSATISFDMIGGDDLDGEPATIFVNGEAVAIYADDHGNITTSDGGVSGISVAVEQQYSNSNEGAGSHGRDSRASYVITVDNPGDNLTLGVSSGADQGTDNEFYAIDDVSVTAS